VRRDGLSSIRPGATTRSDPQRRSAEAPTFTEVLDLLFPRRCVLCDELDTGLCLGCARLLEPCSPASPPGLDSLVVLCRYSGAGRDVVLALKRGNRRDALPQLGAALAAGLQVALGPAGPVGVTWAPTTPTRRRSRGFDQAELLARAVGDAGGWPTSAALARQGGPQHGGSRSQRRSLRFEDRHPVAPVTVLIDDVVASGATMSAAAGALRRAGAQLVVGAAIAASMLEGAVTPSEASRARDPAR
jgi:predicted amidophosphoribosyltransferase